MRCLRLALMLALTLSTSAWAQRAPERVYPAEKYYYSETEAERIEMATTIWTGATSGDWGNNANWSGVEPVASDTVIIPATATQDITSGLENAAVDLDLLYIAEGCTIDIGSDGSYLHISSDKIVHRGNGTLYLKAAAGANTDLIIINADTVGADALVLTSDGNKVTRAVFVKGHVTLAADIGLISYLHITYRNDPYHDAIITAQAGGGGALILYKTAGQFISDVGYTTMYHSGGLLTHQGTVGITTLFMTGGTIDYTSSGNVTNALVLGGMLDFTRNANEVTVGDSYVYPDGEMRLTELITVTTDHDMTGGD